MDDLEKCSFEQLKSKLRAYKGHLTRAMGELHSCAANRVGVCIAEKVMLSTKERLDKVVKVVEFMELKMTEEEAREAAEVIVQKEYDSIDKSRAEIFKLFKHCQANVEQIPTQDSSVGSKPTKLSCKEPEQLKGDANLNQFMEWRLMFDDYRKLAGLDKLPLDVQLANLRLCLDKEMREKVRISMDIPDDTTLTVDEILEAMKKFFRAQYNIILDKVNFQRTIQKDGQTFEDFYVEVQKNAARAELNHQCQSKECLEDQIKVRLIVGLNDEETRTKIMAIPEVESTLQKVVDTCRAEETAKKDDKSLSAKNIRKV